MENILKERKQELKEEQTRELDRMKKEHDKNVKQMEREYEDKVRCDLLPRKLKISLFSFDLW